MRTPVTQAGWRIAIIARGGKMYSYSEIVSILLREFPEINEQYAKEIAWLKDTFQNQESEGQTSYFDHCFCDYIGHLFVDKQQDNLKIEKIFVFLENMATSRDSDVRNLLQVSVFDKGIITRHLKNGANLHQTTPDRRYWGKLKAAVFARYGRSPLGAALFWLSRRPPADPGHSTRKV